jgi:GNAT superfamily N-acetyltransferase
MKSSAEVEIRTATEADVPGILRCLALAFAPYRSQYTVSAYADTVLTAETLSLRLRQMHVLVATLEGKTIGTVAGRVKSSEVGHLRGMAVLPEWHGRGIAVKLLNAIEDWLRSCDCIRTTLNTTEPLKTAMSFYEKNGYRRSGNISDFFGMPLIEYVKDL